MRLPPFNQIQRPATSNGGNAFTYGWGAPSGGNAGDTYLEYSEGFLWLNVAGTWTIQRRQGMLPFELRAAYSGTTGTVVGSGASGVVTAGTIGWSGDLIRDYTTATTATGAGNSALFTMNRWTQAQHYAAGVFCVKFPSLTTNMRFWAGVSTAAFANSATLINEGVALRFCPTDGDTQFQLVQKGTGAQLVASLGVTPTANRTYTFVIWINSDSTVTATQILPSFNYAGGSVLATINIAGSPFTATSDFLSQSVVWSTTAGGAGQRTLSLIRMAGDITR